MKESTLTPSQNKSDIRMSAQLLTIITSTEMMSVADLERITGFTYFVNVPNAPKSTAIASDWGL